MGHLQASPQVRLEIETAVQTAIASSPTLRAARDYIQIWQGAIGHANIVDSAITAHRIIGSVELRQVVDKVETVAVPQSYGTYEDIGSVAVTGIINEFTGSFREE